MCCFLIENDMVGYIKNRSLLRIAAATPDLGFLRARENHFPCSPLAAAGLSVVGFHLKPRGHRLALVPPPVPCSEWAVVMGIRLPFF